MNLNSKKVPVLKLIYVPGKSTIHVEKYDKIQSLICEMVVFKVNNIKTAASACQPDLS